VRLEANNALAQLIPAIGVIVSLFYLAAQIRQNTRSIRAVVVDSLAHSLVDLLGPQAYIPIYYHQPGVKTWWTMRRAAFAAGFHDHLEKSQPVEDLPWIGELIRDESHSAASERT
jgi:hypothetical protein